MTVEEAFRILRLLPEQWGTSESAVSEVEHRLNARLPPPLRELMLCTGRSDHIRWLFPDGEIAPLAELPDLKEVGFEIMEGDSPHLHPTFPFVVLSQHDGYVFTFIRADGSDSDPVVMSDQEGQGYGPGKMSIGLSIAASVRRARSDTSPCATADPDYGLFSFVSRWRLDLLSLVGRRSRVNRGRSVSDEILTRHINGHNGSGGCCRHDRPVLFTSELPPAGFDAIRPVEPLVEATLTLDRCRC